MSIETVSNDSLPFSSQADIETLFSKHQVMPFLREEFKATGVIDEFKSLAIPTGFGLDLLSCMVLYKRANIPTLVGLLRGYFSDDEETSAEQHCANMLRRAVECDVVDYDPVNQVFVVIYNIDEATQKELDKFQYPLPMIVEPETVTNNHETGYQTIVGSLILKQNHHDEDICLDHINRVNAVPLRLNEDVLSFIQNKWKNIDKQKPDESYQDFKARQKAFQKYNRSSREVLTALMAVGNRFWLTHKYDKRGRTYCQGYHANYQGNDWNKACIELAEGEVLNE